MDAVATGEDTESSEEDEAVQKAESANASCDATTLPFAPKPAAKKVLFLEPQTALQVLTRHAEMAVLIYSS